MTEVQKRKQEHMLPYQEQTPLGEISLIVRACHLKTAVRMTMTYCINDVGFNNVCEDVIFTGCLFDGSPTVFGPGKIPLRLTLTEEVFENFTLALEYFHFVRMQVVEENIKTHPPDFKTFLETRTKTT